MSKNYKQNNLVVTHNKKWLKLHEVDSEERYDRVYSFMARTSRYISAEQHLNWWKNFAINKEEIKKWEQELDEAHERRINLTHKVLKEMSEGIINNLTQGIWLSYPYTKEVQSLGEVTALESSHSKYDLFDFVVADRISSTTLEKFVLRKGTDINGTFYFPNYEGAKVKKYGDCWSKQG